MSELLKEKITRLVGRFDQIFSQSDIENSLNEIRKSAETVCKIVLLRFYGDITGSKLIAGEINYKIEALAKPKKLDLSSLIIEVCRSDPPTSVAITTFKAREKIKNYLDAIRSHGNPASHDPDEPFEIVSADDCQYAKVAFKKLVQWLFEDYLELFFPTEIARHFVVRETPSMPNEVTPIKNFEQDLRQWFETIGYRFGDLCVREVNSFRMIIEVLERRGTSKILVIGSTEEVRMSLFIQAEHLQTHYDCDEVWLVSTSTISLSVVNESASRGNCRVFSYSFDDLIEQSVNLEKYFDWIEQEVAKRKILNNYVAVGCERVEIDQTSKRFLAKDVYGEEQGFTEGYLDRWQVDSSKEHVSILGEFGTGKTWLTLHYTHRMISRYKEAKRLGLPRPRLPILIQLRDFAKSVSVDALISDFFFRRHQVELSGVFNAFILLNKLGKVLLIFDGFDEMSDKVNKQKMIDNFWELSTVILGKSKVILTCRTEHFPQIKEGRSLLRAELTESTKHLTGESPQFEVLQLQKLDKAQIEKILSFHTSPDTVEKLLADDTIVELLRRPLMVDLIIDAIGEIESGKLIDLSRIYLYAIRNKLNRDIAQTRTFSSLPDKVYFMCELSWWMLSNDSLKIHYSEFHALTDSLFGYKTESHEVDYWRYDMRGQTMLSIDDEDGYYRPAHKSLLEFFVAFRNACLVGIADDDFMQLVRANERGAIDGRSGVYTWSTYFKRQPTADKSHQSYPQLSNFCAEDYQTLVTSFGRTPFNKADLSLLVNMVTLTNKEVEDRLIAVLEQCRGRSFEKVKFLATNIVALVLVKDAKFWSGKDLSRLCLRNLAVMDSKNFGSKGIYANGFATGTVDFSHTNFSGSDLTDAYLHRRRSFEAAVQLNNADFRGSNLTDFRLSYDQLESMDIHIGKQHMIVGGPDFVALVDLQSFCVLISRPLSGWHVKFSPCGDFVAVSGFGYVDLLNAIDLSSHMRIPISTRRNEKASETENLWTGDFIFLDSGKTLVFGCNTSFVHVHDLVERKERYLLKCIYGCDTMSVNFDCSLLVTGGYNEMIVWDLKSQTALFEESSEKTNLERNIVSFHPRMDILVVISRRSIRFIDSRSFQVVAQFEGEFDAINYVDGGVTALVAQRDNFARFVFEGEKIRRIDDLDVLDFPGELDELSFHNTQLCVDSDTKSIYAISSDHVIRVTAENGDVSDSFGSFSNIHGAKFSRRSGLSMRDEEMLYRNLAVVE